MPVHNFSTLCAKITQLRFCNGTFTERRRCKHHGCPVWVKKIRFLRTVLLTCWSTLVSEVIQYTGEISFSQDELSWPLRFSYFLVVLFLEWVFWTRERSPALPYPHDWSAMIGQTISPLYGGSSKREKDVVTPHSISIILFIEKYARLRPKYWDPRPSGTYRPWCLVLKVSQG